MRWTTKCCIAACLTLLALCGVAQAELKLTLDEKGLRVEGATAGGEVALLSVWMEPERGGPHKRQTNVEETLTDEDADGVVEFETDRPVPILSIWAVVDIESGEAATITPAGFRLRSIESKKEAAFSQQLGRVVVTRRELQVLLVRPGVGNWRGRVRDGAAGDVDGRTDRGVALDLDGLLADKPGDHGPKIAPRDTLIAIDPVWMEVLNLRLD